MTLVQATSTGLQIFDNSLRRIPRMRGQENRECRKVRFALAEDLPLWARFAKDREGNRRHELSWATVCLFPNPIGKQESCHFLSLTKTKRWMVWADSCHVHDSRIVGCVRVANVEHAMPLYRL
jgi:hypothetical protein